MVKTRNDFWSIYTIGPWVGTNPLFSGHFHWIYIFSTRKERYFCTILAVFLELCTLGIGLWRYLALQKKTSQGALASMVKVKLFFHSMLAIVDVFAKYLVIDAFRYTSLTSIMLLDCWTIPCVLLLAWLFSNTKFGLQKLVGVAICVAGLVTVVICDTSSGIKGNLRIIVGATLFGVGNVCEEFFFKKADRVELMALLGINGAILTANQISKFEHDVVESIVSSTTTGLPFIGFSLAMFLFYLGVPLLVKINGSSMLSLSFLTVNLSAVLIRIFAYHEKVDWIYFVGLAAVTLGLYVYLGGDEIDGEAVAIEKEAKAPFLGHSNKDGSRVSFQGARNSLCYILPCVME